MKKRSQLLGLVRLIGINVIIVLLALKINWIESFSKIGEIKIGGIVGIISVLIFIYYHLIKALNELNNRESFQKNGLQNFAIFYSIIILVLIIGNGLISESNITLSPPSFSIGLILIFITFFSLMDSFELWKGRNN